MTIAGSVATINFVNCNSGLTSYNKPVSNFEIAGADKVFRPAMAVISGTSILVSSPLVKEPVAVRYAFRDYIEVNLFGNNGLPVSSFRTDDW